MRIEIDVTQKNKDEGIIGDTNFCPLARAIDEHFEYEIGLLTTVDHRVYRNRQDRWHIWMSFLIENMMHMNL